MTGRDRAIEVIRDLHFDESDEVQVVDALIAAGLIVEPTQKDRVVRLVAEVLAGLQVPISMDGGLLGTAAAPWREIWAELRMFGWTNADEVETALRKVIT